MYTLFYCGSGSRPRQARSCARRDNWEEQPVCTLRGPVSREFLFYFLSLFNLVKLELYKIAFFPFSGEDGRRHSNLKL